MTIKEQRLKNIYLTYIYKLLTEHMRNKLFFKIISVELCTISIFCYPRFVQLLSPSYKINYSNKIINYSPGEFHLLYFFRILIFLLSNLLYFCTININLVWYHSETIFGGNRCLFLFWLQFSRLFWKKIFQLPPVRQNL